MSDVAPDGDEYGCPKCGHEGTDVRSTSTTGNGLSKMFEVRGVRATVGVSIGEWTQRIHQGDPVAGTGTAYLAPKQLGREFVGIEQDARWPDLARVRCGPAAEDYSHDTTGDHTALSAYINGVAREHRCSGV